MSGNLIRAQVSPIKLSEEEVKKPMLVLEDFFGYADLTQVRELLWEWLKTTVTGSYNKSLSSSQRSDLLYFYEHVEKLIEAAHLLHNSKK